MPRLCSGFNFYLADRNNGRNRITFIFFIGGIPNYNHTFLVLFIGYNHHFFTLHLLCFNNHIGGRVFDSGSIDGSRGDEFHSRNSILTIGRGQSRDNIGSDIERGWDNIGRGRDCRSSNISRNGNIVGWSGNFLGAWL